MVQYTIFPTAQTVPNSLVGVAQNSYELLKQSGFNNGNFIFCDKFTDSNGTNNTVNTGSSTAQFDTNKYINGLSEQDLSSLTSVSGMSNGANTFDGDYNTYASVSGDKNYNTNSDAYTVTLPATANIKKIKVKAYGSYNKGNTSTGSMYLQVYNGSWVTVGTVGSVSGTGVQSFNQTQEWLGDWSSVTQVRLLNSIPSCDTYTCYWYELQVWDGYANSTIVCDANTLTFDGTETEICVFSDYTADANASVTFDITDGTNTVSGQPLNSLVDITTLESGTATLTLNLNTTDSSQKADITGYSVVVVRS